MTRMTPICPGACYLPEQYRTGHPCAWCPVPHRHDDKADHAHPLEQGHDSDPERSRP